MEMLYDQSINQHISAPAYAPQKAKILVVDDDPYIRDFLHRIFLRQNCDCRFAASSEEARGYLNSEEFDILLCDINMPGESGVDLMEYAAAAYQDLAVIMLTGVNDISLADRLFQLGAFDYLTKPTEVNRLLISVNNALRRKDLRKENRRYLRNLESIVSERTEKLQKALQGAIHALALTVEARDPYTAGHQRHVSSLAGSIAAHLNLAEEKIEVVRMAGIIHDLGKIYVPSEILNKPGELTQNEFNLIKEHPEVGFNILKDIEFPWPIAEIVLQHHERLDGSGYPQGLKGDEIKIEARILAVADAVEAMASHRPYRAALGLESALAEICRQKGATYDPEAAEACCDFCQSVESPFNGAK